MTRRGAEGQPGFLLAILIFLALALATWFCYVPAPFDGGVGIWLSASVFSHLSPIMSWLSAVGLILLTALIAITFNRSFSVVPGTSIVYSSIYLIACAAQPIVTYRLSASSLLAPAALIGVWLLCNGVGKRRAPAECFLLAAMLSAGSMIHYSFAMLVPLFLLCALSSKVMRFRELIAFMLGVAAPYWIALGLGLVSLQELNIPPMCRFYPADYDKTDFLLTIIMAGTTGLLYVICTLLQAVQLYSANARYRAYYSIFNMLGFGTLVLMAVDFGNFASYIGILNIVMAFSAAALLRRSKAKSTWPPLLTGAAAYIAFYVFLIQL